jgi:alkanesulfonate monooxygenase SsuD/methylene tetrahydromethanopterin reductase-like flavin-dependent oxidoreductase (luciferase family)
MDVGVIVPQGFTGEYDGWEPADAWARSVEIARQADAAGYESIWLLDHFIQEFSQDGLMFESFSAMAALAAVTQEVRLGHIVACVGYRNPALTAKMISTIDVISGGRAELGLGAGWHGLEYEAYGYRFPPLKERHALLADSLEISRRMLDPGHADYQGEQASVRDATNDPRGLRQPRVPIIVGGNGQNVTWRLAARYADELNLDGPSPDEIREWMPIIRSRCEEIGRDPDDLRVSVFLWWGNVPPPGQERADWMATYRDLGVSRIMAWVKGMADSDAALELFSADVLAAGLDLKAD